MKSARASDEQSISRICATFPAKKTSTSRVEALRADRDDRVVESFSLPAAGLPRKSGSRVSRARYIVGDRVHARAADADWPTLSSIWWLRNVPGVSPRGKMLFPIASAMFASPLMHRIEIGRLGMHTRYESSVTNMTIRFSWER